MNLESKVDICYVLAHGFAARMVMQTDLLKKIQEKNLKVAVITPDINDPILSKYCRDNDIKTYGFKLNLNAKEKRFKNLRKYILDDIEKNPALLEKHYQRTRFNKSKNPLSHIKPRLNFLAYKLSNYIPALRRRFIDNEQQLLVSEEVSNLLQEINPHVLISTYPGNYYEGKILYNARKLGINTVIHLLSWDNITCKGIFPSLADFYIAWGPIMQKELQEYYNVSSSNINMTGVPHFDLHFKDLESERHNLDYLDIDKSRKLIFQGLSSPRFAPKEIEIAETIAQNIESEKFGPNVQFVIRPHPQNVQGHMSDKTWLPRLKALESEKVKIFWPKVVKSNLPWSTEIDDLIMLSILLKQADVTLNSGSTLSIDALACKSPVILTSFDGENQLPFWKSARRLIEYTHLKKLTNQGGISVAENYDTLANLINRYLENPEYLIKERQTTYINEVEGEGGNYTENVVNAIQKVVNETA